MFFQLFFSSVFFFSALATSETPLIRENLENKSKSYHEILKLKNLNFLQKDSSYYTSSFLNNFDLIYSEDFKNFAPMLFNYTKFIDSLLSQAFFKKPHLQKKVIIFPSPRKQTSNAFAVIYPISSVLIYPSISVSFMDTLSIFHWPQNTLIHEMTHIYQLSQNSKWDHLFRWILGPLAYRNLLLPFFILEGHAVFKESLYGYGGRLFSGAVRAFVFSQLKQGLSLKRVLKDYNDPFSGKEKYLHGGLFFAYLHSQYGLKKTNHFFSESGLFFPIDFYGLSLALKKTFGKDLNTLFKEYKNHYAPLAEKQKSSVEKALVKSKVSLPMNSNKNHIYFLTSDKKSPPKLILFDKKTSQITKQKKNFPLGKIFYQSGKYYSSSSARTSSNSIEYSLFKEGFQPVKKYNSQYIMDIYKKTILSLDTSQNHTQNTLLLNHRFYDNTHSSAIMDHKGQVYYFKQNKNIRILYKNKKPLLRLKSYYAYPVEADKEGLYFIGATRYGSSLFLYKEGQDLLRLSSSDTIVYGRKINKKYFLVSEITPTHYQYKVIPIQAFSEKPYFYTYSFNKEALFKKSQKAYVQKTSKEKSREVLPTSKEKKMDPLASKPRLWDNSYNSLSALSLCCVFSLLSFPNAEKGLSLFSSFQFLDPLQWNRFSFDSFFNKNRKLIQLSYSYKQYRPTLSVSFTYNNSHLQGKKNKYELLSLKELGFLEKKELFTAFNEFKKDFSTPYKDRAIRFSFLYPLIKKAQWNLSFTSTFQFGQKQFQNSSPSFWLAQTKNWKNYFQQKGEIRYQYKRKYPYAFSSYSQKSLKLSYDVFVNKVAQNYKSQLSGQIQAYLKQELGKEWYLSLNGLLKRNAWNRKPQNLLFKTDADLFFDYNSFKYTFKNLSRFDIQILKVLNLAYYPLTLPFALRRWAPLMGLSFLSLTHFENKQKYFLIPFFGVEAEWSLLLQKTYFKTGLAGEYVFDFSSPLPLSFQFSSWLKTNF